MPAGASSFPPIADYGFLSDCHTTALVAPSGNVEWMCVPRMDSPSVFGAILDRDAGGFRIGPADVAVPAGRRYLPGTMVLETSWETPTGWVVVRDVLSIGPWHHEEERSPTYRRSPTDHDAEHVLVRTVKCVQGSVEIHLDCEPAFDYGGLVAGWDYGAAGDHEAVATSEGMDTRLRLATDLLGFEGPRARARTSCTPATRRSRRSDGPTRRCRRATARPTSASLARRSTGRSGCSTARSRTTAGAR